MELLDAIKHILLKNKKPMHSKEIAKIITNEKLVEKKWPQTLESIINSKIALEIKKAEKQKLQCDFIKLNNGLIGLKNYEDNEKNSQLIEISNKSDNDYSQVNINELSEIDKSLILDYKNFKEQYIELLNKLPFLVFERLFEDFLRSFGFIKYTIVNRRTDGGIDYALNLCGITSNVNMLLAIRRWLNAKKYNVKHIEEFVKSMSNHKFNLGVIISFSDYETEVYEYVNNHSEFPITLLKVEHLVDMLISKKIGVIQNLINIYKLDTNYIEILNNEVNQKLDKLRKINN